MSLDKLINVVVVHLSKFVMPDFKRKKCLSYVNAIKHFSMSESSNSEELTKVWHLVVNSIEKIYT